MGAHEGEKAFDIRFEDYCTFRGEVKEVRSLRKQQRECFSEGCERK